MTKASKTALKSVSKPEDLPKGSKAQNEENRQNNDAQSSNLTPSDEALFRSFQANLLSLISHELRTPLTGILNSLSLLDDGESSGEFSAVELISMARKNALRLNQTLSELLDLAAIDSGTFEIRLREIHLDRLVRSRLSSWPLRDRSIRLDIQSKVTAETTETSPALADPQRLGRAVDLCMQLVLPRCQNQSKLEVHILPRAVEFAFQITQAAKSTWNEIWANNAFEEAIASERAFLTRSEEGLRSEAFLITEIMKKHKGAVSSKLADDDRMFLRLDLPTLTSREVVHEVIGSRAAHSTTSLGTVALGLIQCPKGSTVQEFAHQIRNSLFRATDAVYLLPEENRVALIMDDCKKEDVPRLLKRVAESLGAKLKAGIVICPDEGQDPELLIRMAEKRISGTK